MKKISSYYSTF